MDKFNPRIAIIEPSKNAHHQTGLESPSYLCRPEVRKARHEILKKERPPTPSRTIATAVKTTGDIFPTNEDDENFKYNERSRIVSPKLSSPVQVTIENFDEPNTKPTTILQSSTHSPKFGRRASMQPNSSVDAKINSHMKRNQTKIVEGNSGYGKGQKKDSLTSTTSTEDEPALMARRKMSLMNQNRESAPSFVILKEPCKENKWMKSSWYT